MNSNKSFKKINEIISLKFNQSLLLQNSIKLAEEIVLRSHQYDSLKQKYLNHKHNRLIRSKDGLKFIMRLTDRLFRVKSIKIRFNIIKQFISSVQTFSFLSYFELFLLKIYNMLPEFIAQILTFLVCFKVKKDMDLFLYYFTSKISKKVYQNWVNLFQKYK